MVRHGKFNKSRELVLHASTVAALRGYLRERDRLHPVPSSPALLISTAGTRLLYCNVHWTFHRPRPASRAEICHGRRRAGPVHPRPAALGGQGSRYAPPPPPSRPVLPCDKRVLSCRHIRHNPVRRFISRACREPALMRDGSEVQSGRMSGVSGW